MNTKVPVSERALFARVARKLAKDCVTLHRCRENSRWFQDLGRYYCAGANNFVCGPCLDSLDLLADYARENGLLKPHEEVVDA